LPFFRFAAPNWSARCRLSCKMSLSMPPGLSSRAPDAEAATAFVAFMRGEQAKQLMRANGLDPA
jgi:ABC-type molybdate transport system substrate-binding protein